MRDDEIVCEISVCEECMFVYANGEADPERPDDQPDAWALLQFGDRVTMGGSHREGCPNYPDGGTGYIECDCDSLGFTQSSCEGCGDKYHGDRYKFTLWRTRIPAARRGHAACVEFARTAETPASAHHSLALAAKWRGFIRSRLAERD